MNQPKEKKHYIDRHEFYNAICESQDRGSLTPKASSMLILLAENTIECWRYYNGQEDKNDCLQAGLFDLFNNWHKFDRNKSNQAFAYFTEVFKKGIYRGFNELYKKRGDPENRIKLFSMNSANSGEGLFNF
jgi:hypothetical protein